MNKKVSNPTKNDNRFQEDNYVEATYKIQGKFPLKLTEISYKIDAQNNWTK